MYEFSFYTPPDRCSGYSRLVYRLLGNDCPNVGCDVLFHDPSAAQTAKRIAEIPLGVEKGDKVVTVGGIYGTVAEIEEKTVLLKVDGEIKLRVDKGSLVKDYSSVQQ